MEERRKEKLKACIAIALIILAILIVGILSMKYSVEGEFNMPFILSKITVVSTAEGVENEGATEKWNLSLYQNNDVYFSIEKNEKNQKETMIESISIENIEITQKPKIGTVQVYMPNSLEGRLFSYAEEYIVSGNKLTYRGANKSNTKTLEIGNQGGTALIRFSNAKVGDYVSNEEEEMEHDGRLLSKTKATLEELNFKVTFDFVIHLKNASYVAPISLELPCQGNLIEKGTTSTEITDGFIFKRN